MAELGVLGEVLPEGFAPARLDALVAAGAPADPLLRLAALLDGDAAALGERLRLGTAERTRLLALRDGAVPQDDADDNALRRALADVPRDVLIGRAWLAGRGDALRDRLAALPAPVFGLHGRDLKAAGVADGPAMGALLRDVRAWWLAGGCTGDVRAELARRLAERR